MNSKILFLAILFSLLLVPTIANNRSNRGDVLDDNSISTSSSVHSVPEPGTLTLLLSGLVGLSGYYLVGKKKK